MANGGSSGQQQIKPTRTCLVFAAIPLTTFPAGVGTWDLTPYLDYLHIHSLPQPSKTLTYPWTLSHLHWAQKKTNGLCPQSLQDLHCQTGRNTLFFFSLKSNNLFLCQKITKYYLDQPIYPCLRALHASVVEICIKNTNAKMTDCAEV